jgi:hypothetical protein
MSLLWASSVSRYANADAAQEWTTFQTNCSIVAGASRSGGGVVRSLHTASAGIFSKGVNASGSLAVLHFAWKPGVLAFFTVPFLEIVRAGTAMISFGPTTGGGLVVKRGATTLITTGGGFVSDGVWVQVQLKVLIHDTAGTVECRLNGNPTPVINLTGVDTNNAGDGGWDSIRFMAATSGGAVQNNDFCDFVFLDGVDATATQGKPYNDFLGDCSVRPHFPNGLGASATWTRVGTDSGVNWSQVDEAIANSDTDGVQTSTLGARDTYAMEDLKATGQAITAVVPVAQVKKLDAGFASLGPAFRYGGVNYDPAAGIVPATVYAQQQMLNGLWVGLHPSGVPWTEANFNATESGPYKVG